MLVKWVIFVFGWTVGELWIIVKLWCPRYRQNLMVIWWYSWNYEDGYMDYRLIVGERYNFFVLFNWHQVLWTFSALKLDKMCTSDKNRRCVRIMSTPLYWSIGANMCPFWQTSPKVNSIQFLRTKTKIISEPFFKKALLIK